MLLIFKSDIYYMPSQYCTQIFSLPEILHFYENEFFFVIFKIASAVEEIKHYCRSIGKFTCFQLFHVSPLPQFLNVKHCNRHWQLKQVFGIFEMTTKFFYLYYNIYILLYPNLDTCSLKKILFSSLLSTWKYSKSLNLWCILLLYIPFC